MHGTLAHDRIYLMHNAYRKKLSKRENIMMCLITIPHVTQKMTQIKLQNDS
jgi:hypothetical protein